MIPILYILIIAVSVVGGILGKMMPSFVLLAKFTYPNAKYNAIGNPFVKNEEIQKILARDLDDFKSMVNMNRDFELTGDTVEVIQGELDLAFQKMIRMVACDSPSSVTGFYEAYLYKLDLPFLKKSVGEFLRGEKHSDGGVDALGHQIYLSETRDFLREMYAGEPSDLSSLLQRFHYPGDLIALFEGNLDELDFGLVELAFDRSMLSRFDRVRVPKQCQGAVRTFVMIYKDILNIKMILRAKEFGLGLERIKLFLVGRGRELEEWKLTELLEMEDVPEVISHLEGTSYMPYLRDAIVRYEKGGSVSVLEHALDVCFLHLLGDLAIEHTNNLGVGIRFVVSREYETRNLKVIAKGLLEGLPLDIIKKSLVIE